MSEYYQWFWSLVNCGIVFIVALLYERLKADNLISHAARIHELILTSTSLSTPMCQQAFSNWRDKALQSHVWVQRGVYHLMLLLLLFFASLPSVAFVLCINTQPPDVAGGSFVSNGAACADCGGWSARYWHPLVGSSLVLTCFNLGVNNALSIARYQLCSCCICPCCSRLPLFVLCLLFMSCCLSLCLFCLSHSTSTCAAPLPCGFG